MTTIYVKTLTPGVWLVIHLSLSAGYRVRVHVGDAAPFLVRSKAP